MPTAQIDGGLGDVLPKLEGTWSNQPFSKGGPGGTDQPFSYNVMPLPQDGANGGLGYILKNFSLYENVQFNTDSDIALPATAPNRGGDTLQVPTALFYQQQVFFAEGPDGVPGQVVHVENGAWLNLLRADPLTGPYPPPPGSGITGLGPGDQPPSISIAKQMSIPHGNSILALGHIDAEAGAPDIPNSASTFPAGLDTTVYTTEHADPSDYQNPSIELTANPNKALQDGVAALEPTKSIHWTVSSGNQGSTMNIPFEEAAANVSSYSADYWLLSVDGTSFDHLAYSQVINMTMLIAGKQYSCPHVTTNIVTRN